MHIFCIQKLSRLAKYSQALFRPASHLFHTKYFPASISDTRMTRSESAGPVRRVPRISAMAEEFAKSKTSNSFASKLALYSYTLKDDRQLVSLACTLQNGGESGKYCR